jgi:hypothetical protein
VRDYRTFAATLAGLTFLLALAWISGTLHLDATMTNGLALAGTGMVSALAGKSSIQHYAAARTARAKPQE